jgi:preprotein translocase subunit SecA
MHPLNEFHKVLAEAFWKLLMDIEERIVEDLARLQITKGRIVLDDKVVQGPSATWTYLINDQVSTDLQNMLFGHGSTAIAAGAVLMTWPLLLAWGIWRRWKNRRLIP